MWGFMGRGSWGGYVKWFSEEGGLWGGFVGWFCGMVLWDGFVEGGGL